MSAQTKAPLAADEATTPRPVIIAPTRRWPGLEDLAELWVYRELLWVLAGRDVRVRYRQTLLGVLWAMLQPSAQAAVFTVVLGRLAGVPSDGVPYALFAYAGLLPWGYFAGALGRVTGSVVGASSLITRVYFPRLVLPLAATLSPLVDLGCAALVYVGLMAYYGVVPTWGLALLPAFVALAWMTALGVGLWLSAVNVHYRDIGYTLPLLTQLWMFATPIVYPASLLPGWARPYLGLNPMAGVVEGFRWALLGRGGAPGPELAVSAATASVLLVSGALFFRRMERTFADIV